MCENIVAFIFSTKVLSWIQYIAWVAIAIGALIAAINLKRNTQQARANFLIALIPMWEKLSVSRTKMYAIKAEIITGMSASQNAMNDEERLNVLRDSFAEKIREIKEDENIKDLHLIYDYLNFFEAIGLMVSKRYILFSDVCLLYKGPIIDMELAFSKVIPEWNKQFHESEGMYENVLYLIDKVRVHETRARTMQKLKFWRNS